VTTPRYRCTACGNLTRFDVTTTTTEKAYFHYSVGGELTVEDPVVVRSSVDEVSCRWCGHGRAVEARTDEHAGTDAVPEEGTA
jgi:DNA-directed RNA polymerase subunit RPC12/RpoP